MAEYDRDAYIEQSKARMEELTDKLETGMQELFDSEKYKAYLRSMSHFHHYSSRNVMLILQQLPEATRVASFKVWADEFNRYPKKGEKSIRIFAPIEIKKTVEMQKIDPDTKTCVRNGDGNIVTEEKEIKQQRFKPVPVFDISQTEGDPLPQLAEDLAGDVAYYPSFMEALKEVSPVSIIFETLPPGHDGYYSRRDEKIGIREGMSESQTIATIVHELAHARMHNGTDAFLNRDLKELEAESVAYVVCGRLGIETGANSFGYLASWSKGDPAAVRGLLDRIRREASALIGEIETAFVKQYEKTLPDQSVTLAERDAYGYTDNALLPLRQERAAELWNENCQVYLLYADGTEAAAESLDDMRLHAVQGGLFGIERETWEAHSQLPPERSESEQNFAAWMAVTKSSEHRWVEDEIYRLNGRGAMYYTGGEDGIYLRIQADGTLEAGNYEGAFPHIGEATFMPVVTKEYDSYSAAFQAAMEAGGKQFMVDMLSGSESPSPAAPKADKPSLRETLAANAQKSKELYGDGAPTQSAPQLEETI